MLRVDDLRVHYGRITALRGVSFHVDEGEVVGMIGPNGAGKTTTLSTIVGFVAPAGGTITFEGRSIAGDAPERIVRRGITLVPEGRRIFSTLTVEENLLMGATIRRREAGPDVERLLERFPILRTYFRQAAGKLSGGEQQQLAIARALLSRPKLLLLDEPSLGLSPLMVDLVFEVLDGLRQEGVTILLVEQNARRTLEFADRTYVLRNGGIELEGTRASLRELEKGEMEAAFLGFGGR
jgi:branched-chain amino acid transport system ATP-binding protein